jgi:hypothetical protein
MTSSILPRVALKDAIVAIHGSLPILECPQHTFRRIGRGAVVSMPVDHPSDGIHMGNWNTNSSRSYQSPALVSTSWEYQSAYYTVHDIVAATSKNDGAVPLSTTFWPA